MNTDVDRCAYGHPRGIDQRYAVIRTITDDYGSAVGRDARQSRLIADTKSGSNGALVDINHRNVGRSRVRNVGMVAVGGNVNEVRPAVDTNGGDDPILLGINHADI